MGTITNNLKVQGTTERTPSYKYKGVYDATHTYEINDVYYKDNKYYVVGNGSTVEYNDYPMLDDRFEGGESLSSANLNEAINSSVIMTNALENFLTTYNQNSFAKNMVEAVKFSIDNIGNNVNDLYNVTSEVEPNSNNYNQIKWKVNGNEARIIGASPGLKITKWVNNEPMISHDGITEGENYQATTQYIASNENNSNYWGFHGYANQITVDNYSHISSINRYEINTPAKPTVSTKTWELNDKDIDGSHDDGYRFTEMITNNKDLYSYLSNMSQNKKIIMEIVYVGETSSYKYPVSMYINGLNFTITSNKDTWVKINDLVEYKINEINTGNPYRPAYYVASLKIDGRNFYTVGNNTATGTNLNLRTFWVGAVRRIVFHTYNM